MHPSPPARLPRRVLCRLRRLHPLPGGIQRVLQPEAKVGPLHHREHLRPPLRLQEGRQDQRQHIPPLHRIPEHAHDRNNHRAGEFKSLNVELFLLALMLIYYGFSLFSLQL